MRSIFLSSVYVIAVFFVHAQPVNTDSLKSVISNHEISDQEQLDALLILCEYQISNVPPSESIPYFKKMLSLTSTLNNMRKEATAYLYLSESYMRLENFEKAKWNATQVISKNKNNTNRYLLGINALGRVYHHFQKYNQAISTYKKGIDRYIKQPEGEIISSLYMNMGIAYDRLEDHVKEMQCYVNGLKFADSLDNGMMQNFASYSIAGEYRDLKEYKKSEKYYLQGLSNAKNNHIEVYTSMNYHGLGILYSRWGKYDFSLKYNLLALENYRKQGNELYEFDVLNNMAVLFYRMDSLEKSLQYGKQALFLAEKLEHRLAIIGAKETLGGSYLKKGELKKAEYYLSQVLPDIDDPLVFGSESRITLLENMSSLREKQGLYKEALEYFKQMKNESDSQTKKERFNHVTRLEQQYQTEKKEKDLVQKNNKILSQKLEIEKEARKNVRLVFIMILSFVAIAILGFFFLRRRRLMKHERKLYIIEVEKNNAQSIKWEEMMANQQENYTERMNSFHAMLKEKYRLSPAEIEYWILQANGIEEEEMQSRLYLAKSSIDSRRKKLYRKLKEHEKIDFSQRFSKSKSVRIYSENRQISFI